MWRANWGAVFQNGSTSPVDGHLPLEANRYAVCAASPLPLSHMLCMAPQAGSLMSSISYPSSFASGGVWGALIHAINKRAHCRLRSGRCN